MSYTEYLQTTSGQTVYAKLRPYSATWGDETIAMAENASTGEYSASTFADGRKYGACLQAGGSPAASDQFLGYINPTDGELSQVINSGEQFRTTSAYETDRDVTFTRI